MYKCFLFFLFSFLLGACTNVEVVETNLFFTPTDGEQKISLKPNGDIDVNFSSFEDSVSFEITTQTDWNISFDDQMNESWCDATPRTGKSGTTCIMIKAQNNSTESDRAATLKVQSGTSVKNINIKQVSREPLSFGEGVKTNDNVRILDNHFSKYVVKYSDNQIILDSSLPSNLMPNIDDILVFPLQIAYRPAYIGKVTSITYQDGKIVIDMEIPSMDEMFTEFSQDVKLNSSNVHVAVDPNSEGEDYDCKVVDNSVWDEMDSYIVDDENDSASTRGSIGTDGIENVDFTIEIPIEKKVFTGKVYIRIHGNIKMLSTSSADMLLHQEIGLKGDLNWADVPAQRKFIPILKGKKLPIMGSLLAGLVLKPELDLFYEGEIKVQSGLNCEIISNDFICKIRDYKVESASTKEKKRKIYFRVKNIYTRGEIGLSTTGALFYLVGDERLMSFGANLEAGVGISGEKSVGIQFPQIVNFDFNVSVYPFVYISPWVQFSGKTYKKDKLVQFKGDPYLVSLLPTFAINQAQIINKKVSVDTDVNKQSFISSKDNGVALFKKDASTPIMKSSTNNGNTRSIGTRASYSQNYNLSFSVADNGEYEIAPYIETADGEMVFGERVPVRPGWMEEFYNSTNGDKWIHNDNWLTEKPIYEWYGCHRGENYIDLSNNNLTGNGVIRNAPNLQSINLLGNNLQSLYIEDCPNINPGYGFSVNGLKLESLTFNRCIEGHGQSYFDDYSGNAKITEIKNILIQNVNSLGRVFFLYVKSDYIEFKNCHFSGQGSSCEYESQVSTLCFDNCVVPSGRLENANGNLVIKNSTVYDNWVIGGKHITITNSTIDGKYIGSFSGSKEDYRKLWRNY